MAEPNDALRAELNELGMEYIGLIGNKGKDGQLLGLLEKLQKLGGIDALHKHEAYYWFLYRSVEETLLSNLATEALAKQKNRLSVEGNGLQEHAQVVIEVTKISKLIYESAKAVRSMSYLQKMSEGEEEDCPICMQGLKLAKVTPCSHSFHSLCLFKSLMRGVSSSGLCPLCRSNLM